MSEVEDLLKEQSSKDEEQVTANKYLELLEDSSDYLEDLLLEQMITNDEIGGFKTVLVDFGKGIINEISALSGVVSSFKELVTPPEPIEPDEALSPATDKVAGFFKSQDERDSEIKNIMSANSKIQQDALNEEEKFKKSFMGQVTNLVNKVPGVQIGGGDIQTPATMEVPSKITDEEGYADLETVGERQLFMLTNIDKVLSEQLRLFKDGNKDVGTSSSLTGGKEKDKDEGSMFDMFDNIPGMGMFKKLAKKFPKLIKGFKVFGKILGKAAIVLGTFLFIKDLFDGMFNDEAVKDITGKASKDLEASESTAASIANGIAGILSPLNWLFESIFGMKDGLVSVQDIFGAIEPVFALLNKGIDQIFDPEEGIFGKVTSSLFKLLDGDFMGALTDMGDAFLDIPTKIMDKLSSVINYLLGTDIDITGIITEGITKKVKQVMDIGGNVADMAGGALDSVGDFFGFGGDKKKEVPVEPKTTAADIVAVNKLLPDMQAQSLSSNKAGKGLSRAIAQKPETFATPIPRAVDERASKLSKQRLDDDKVVVNVPQAPPVVVQMPKESNRQTIRRTSADDAGMLIANGAIGG